MLESYPATEAQKQVLRSPPKNNRCLLPRELENLKNYTDVIVYLWLKAGRGYWYHILYAKDNVLTGYLLINGRWRYRPVPIRKISKYF